MSYGKNPISINQKKECPEVYINPSLENSVFDKKHERLYRKGEHTADIETILSTECPQCKQKSCTAKAQIEEILLQGKDTRINFQSSEYEKNLKKK